MQLFVVVGMVSATVHKILNKITQKKRKDESGDEINNGVEVKKPQPSGQLSFNRKDAEPKPVDLQGLQHRLYLTPKHEELVSDILYILKDGGDMGHLRPTGILLTGAPGVGKTVVINYALQQYSENTKKPVELYKITKDDPAPFISSIFKVAREHAKVDHPVVILIDEIDSLGTKEMSKYSGNGGPLSGLLMELDGIAGKNNNVLVIGATNYPENVDYRLQRSGRIDKIIDVPLPDYKSRLEMLKIHIKDKSLPNPHKFDLSDEDLVYIAKRTFGYTPADLRSCLSDLFLTSGKKGVKKPARAEIDNELKYFKPTLTRDMLDFCEPEITLDSLILETDFKSLLMDYVQEDAANILLYGPKGCGKTVLPEALAGSLGCRLVKTNAAELQEGIVGESQKKIRKIFDRSKQLAPTILLIDEIEGIIELNGMMSHKSDETSFINSYLSQPIPGVTVVATTNDPTRINNTTLSRFEPVYVGLPTEKQIEDYLVKNGMATELNGTNLEGYSFRDLERIHKSIKFAKKHNLGPEKIHATLQKYQPENNNCGIDWKYVNSCVGGGLI